MSSRVYCALLATFIVNLAGEADAFEVKHTADGHLVSWRSSKVTWTIDSSVRKVPGGEAAVVAATDAWTRRGGAPALAVVQRGANVEPGLDGTNAVFFVEGGFAPAGKALAVTVLSFDDLSGEVLDADIVLNGKYELGDVAKGTSQPKAATAPGGAMYDVGRIVAHEMGHALALSDEPADPAALMYPYVARAVSLATSPGDDDVAGLSTLYADVAGGVVAPGGQSAGGAPSAAACATVPLRSSRSQTSTYLTAGLALLALAVAMARSARGARARRGAAGCTMLAAAALIVLPPSLPPSPSPSRREVGAVEGVDVKAIVTRVSTTSTHGLFRSELDLSPTSCALDDCPPSYRFVAWGGTIGHVRQVVGGAPVPEAGDPVALSLEPVAPAVRPQERVVRAMTRLEQ